MNLLLDTNILLDVILEREPFAADAAVLWGLAESGHFVGTVAAISFANVFYVVRRLRGQVVAEESLSRILQVFRVAGVNAAEIDRAMALPIGDFEDALQIACAEAVGAVALVTRDRAGFAQSPLPAWTPEVALTSLRAG